MEKENAVWSPEIESMEILVVEPGSIWISHTFVYLELSKQYKMDWDARKQILLYSQADLLKM